MKNILLWIGLMVFLFGMAWGASRYPLSPQLALLSFLFVVIFALPSYIVCLKYFRKKGVFLLIVLGLFALAIESIALFTGYPYGEFTYLPAIGLLVFDFLPPSVFFAWPPLVFGSVALASHISHKKWIVIMLSTLFLVIADLVLDPGAVKLGYWKYTNGGFFYDVPLSNFVGWIVSGIIGSCIVLCFLPIEKPLPKGMMYSFIAILIFWTGIALVNGLVTSALVGIAFSIFILWKLLLMN